MHTIYRNVIKTSKWQWIADQVTSTPPPYPLARASVDAFYYLSLVLH